MRHVYSTLRDAGYSVAGCAPTGKAARRIKEATGIPAKTIHRLLEFTHPGERDPKTGVVAGYSYPKRTRQNPLDYDVILADEYAMVNKELHRDLMNGMKAGARICVFGDVNQLPPIESTDQARASSSPFETLLKDFKGITLTTIHRQGEGSGIVTNGQRILNGFMPTGADDFKVVVTELIIDKLLEYLFEMADAGYDFKTLQNQVLTPANISWIGTHALNQKIKQAFVDTSCSDDEVVLPRHDWESKHPVSLHVGDKVMINQNLYEIESEPTDEYPNGEIGVFNGETGIYVGMHEDGFSLRIDLGDRIGVFPPYVNRVNRYGKTYQYSVWKDIYLAYAVTVHKAQGSEFQNVAYLMSKSVFKLLNRSNFYTAVTRARKSVRVFTDQRGLMTALSTRRPSL